MKDRKPNEKNAPNEIPNRPNPITPYPETEPGKNNPTPANPIPKEQPFYHPVPGFLPKSHISTCQV